MAASSCRHVRLAQLNMYFLTLSWFCIQPHPADSFSLPPKHSSSRSRSRFSTTTKLQAHPPSWNSLEKVFGDAYTASKPSCIDSVLQPEPPIMSSERPTLFRERHGWCPYSERVWLTLETLGVSYDTIRIDNTGGGRPSYYNGGQTPQMRWPDGTMQGESYDLVQALDERYGKNILQCHKSETNDMVNRFRSIFPRARPSSRAAFLFQYNGDPLGRTTFEETLEQTNALLGQTEGSFFCGDSITGADIAWAPFLERYRYQLPCLHDKLEPDDPAMYPHLANWYTAMETQVPAYACRVKGDASSWRKVLTMAGFGNAGLPPDLQQNVQSRITTELETAASIVQPDLWKDYRASRSYVATTPAAEAAMIMTQNRDRILADARKQKQKLFSDHDEIDLDNSMRALVALLVAPTTSQSDKGITTSCSYDLSGLGDQAEGVGKLALFLDERMCVPRDMGAMSAACIKDVAYQLQ